MSDNDKSPKTKKVGYGQPPVGSQFKPGQSGNRRGRPKKRVAGVLPAELVRAILLVGNTDVPMNTPAGKINIPGYQAVIAALMKSAMSGRIQSAKVFLEMYENAVKEYVRWNPMLKIHDNVERDLLSGNREIWPEGSDYSRRSTRRILSDKIDPDFPKRKGDPKR